MKTYAPLWETMKQKGTFQYILIKEFHISEVQLHCSRKNMVVIPSHWIVYVLFSIAELKIFDNM